MANQAQHVLPRIYRRDSDSSSFASPRVFARTFCEMKDLEKTVKFYEGIASVSLDQDISLPEAGFHVVAVGGFLIVTLNPQLLDANRREMAARTPVTMIFADVDAAVRRARSEGAEIIQDRFVFPHGAGYRMRHADGLVVEYLEHRPSEYDSNAPSPMFRL